MGTIIRRNERSWAIVIITEIKVMLNGLGLKIKSAGGESTLSVNKKSMFPDVLLYEDEAQTKILQGWELKMPDVLITDETLIADATRKAKALGLNSFVIWNFTYGKLYIQNQQGFFEEAKVWDGTSHIQSREDVTTYKAEWLPIIKDIVLTVNEYLVTGKITTSSITGIVSESIMAELIQRNKEIVAENITIEASHNTRMESRIKVWWNVFHEEYDKDESNMYSAYAKSILLNWTNRVMFANAIKKYHNCAYKIKQIDFNTSPEDGNLIIQQIIDEGDFYNVFNKIDFNELVPEDTWIDIVDFNQFLVDSNMDKIDQSVLQEILEKTVNVSKREMRGQYATPTILADFLSRITVDDWNKDCADLCAGTGTIAKAIIRNKTKRLATAEQSFISTWMSDKYAYPLQIANISITDIQAINIPLNMFQRDVFSINVGDEIKIKSPIDGSEIKKIIPKFGAIISNLPFVEYNKIAKDEQAFITEIRKNVQDNTGIEFTLGKTDLYNFIPFKLHELLDTNGKLGIILSNSWLGTDIGRKFFDALQYYYVIEAVVASDNKRWFKNADVVGTLLIMQKKSISQPDLQHKVSFWLVKKDIHSIDNDETEVLVNSIVLNEILEPELATFKQYSYQEIIDITNYGLTLNTLFHDVLWVKKIADKLVPISRVLDVKRGERRGWNDLFYPSDVNDIEAEYIRSVLKNPARLKSYKAETDIEAFCCHRSKSELEELGHNGALAWIERFEHINNGSGKPLPIALKRSGCFWYEMDDSARADFVTALNPDKRLFVAKFEKRTFVDQRFTRMLLKSENLNSELVHAVLNSLYGMFAIEAIGFGRGLGVLDASSTRLKNMYMIDIEQISQDDAEEILRLFENIKGREVMDVEDELRDSARREFDNKVLQSIGAQDLYDKIKDSLLSLQHTRHCIK